MIEINRILLQLDKAVDCANSPYIQERAMAVTLFDNLIEVQLYKRVEKLFLFDSTTWHGGGRKFNRKTRKETVSNEGKFDKLLKFASENGIIEKEDFDSLKYARKIRNEVYHRGELSKLKLDLAIITYFSFLSRTLKTWGTPSIFYSYSGNDPSEEEIDFGQGFHKGDILSFKHEKYLMMQFLPNLK